MPNLSAPLLYMASNLNSRAEPGTRTEQQLLDAFTSHFVTYCVSMEAQQLLSRYMRAVLPSRRCTPCNGKLCQRRVVPGMLVCDAHSDLEPDNIFNAVKIMGAKLGTGGFQQHVLDLVAQFNFICPVHNAALPWAAHPDLVDINAVMSTTNANIQVRA